MPRRTYSPHTLSVAKVLGAQIKIQRKLRHLTLAALAERAGISRSWLQRIEAGDPRSEMGVVFEVAHLAGVELLAAEADIPSIEKRQAERLALLPAAVRPRHIEANNDF
ncbi:helix-turn-helix domain-containing protein [Pseudomonas sp. NPDC007930]|uniref:helix-turn-helix domain-containing protein n=1 Tax=Pseudomonas sp. NPDC007930 TaxID=3364417 RepID=UPI0036E663CD